MTITSAPQTFDPAALTRAIEARDADAQIAAYAPDAEHVTVDAQHGPSTPDVLRGSEAIGAYLRDICARDMTHEVTAVVCDGDRLALEVACAYPDGTRVLCHCIAQLRDGRIASQRTVQAWDT